MQPPHLVDNDSLGQILKTSRVIVGMSARHQDGDAAMVVGRESVTLGALRRLLGRLRDEEM